MNKKILLIIALISLLSCKSFVNQKCSYVKELEEAQKVRLVLLELNNFDLYTRQIIRKRKDTFYGTLNPKRVADVHTINRLRDSIEYPIKDYEKLELQYIFIEKSGNKGKRKVIFISTLQPYKPWWKKRMSYDSPLFYDDKSININYFNSFKLGYIDSANSVITFYKNPYQKSYWYIKKDTTPKSIQITSLKFDYKTKFSKYYDTQYPLNKKTSMPIEYHHLDNFQFMFNNNLDNLSLPNSAYTSKIDSVFFDEINKRMYFHFPNPDERQDEGKGYGWLFFRSGRTLNYWMD
jgi:hypothetical protein